MLGYQAPLKDMQFVMNDVFSISRLLSSCDFPSESFDSETVSSILGECARFVTDKLYPLNRSGDEAGLSFHQGEVFTPRGFKEAYDAWAEGGWISFTGTPEFGGMGMPKTLAMFVGEMLFASNSSFALYPELAGGGAHLISRFGEKTMKALYLPKLYAGEWSATMCLTESHCGSDLGLLRTKAISYDDCYRITGEKIFISGGEHDLTSNIVHLVLARLPNAPEGVKGITLFLVPKFLVNDKGECEAENSVSCTGVEKKMGLKAAATCVMNFDEAVGYLVGEPHQGLAAMFSMMNYERLSIAMQGLGAGDASYQTALAYAKQRIQGKRAGSSSKESVPIIKHGDVRRMLLTMKALNEGGRAFAFYVATYFDQAERGNTSEERKKAAERLSLLTPVVKAFLTDMGFDVCVLGQQVLGGHGYIREWGQEQHVRDVRIAQIYEGTNGIQALDLLMRKVLADKGKAFNDFIGEIIVFVQKCNSDKLREMAEKLEQCVKRLQKVTQHFMQNAAGDIVNASAMEYLHMFGYICYAYMWLKMACTAEEKLVCDLEDDQLFVEAKLHTAAFYFQRILPRTEGLAKTLGADTDLVLRFNDAMF